MSRLEDEVNTIVRRAFLAKTHVAGGFELAPPILPAVASRDGVNAIVWCRYCDDFHCHGNGDGGRVAHCVVSDSPYRETGYVLEMVPGAPASLRPPRSERRRPRSVRYDSKPRHGWGDEKPYLLVMEIAGAPGLLVVQASTIDEARAFADEIRADKRCTLLVRTHREQES